MDVASERMFAKGTLVSTRETAAALALTYTGRPGYPLRAMVGMALAKSIYSIPTWTRTVALVREHDALREAIGGSGESPSHSACYRFAAKLRAYSDLLDASALRLEERPRPRALLRSSREDDRARYGIRHQSDPARPVTLARSSRSSRLPA
jgi:hypothetical protein